MRLAVVRSRKAIDAAPKWRVRTRGQDGRWTCRYVCLSAGEAADRYGQLVDAGWTVEVVPPTP